MARPRKPQVDNPIIALRLLRLSSYISAQGREILSRYGVLTYPEWRIVRVLGLGAADVSADVAKMAGIDRSQFSRTLRPLVEQGLIAMVPSNTDRRKNILSLTPKGHEIHDRIAPDLVKRQEWLVSHIPADQRASFLETLDALTEAAQSLEFLDDIADE